MKQALIELNAPSQCEMYHDIYVICIFIMFSIAGVQCQMKVENIFVKNSSIYFRCEIIYLLIPYLKAICNIDHLRYVD